MNNGDEFSCSKSLNSLLSIRIVSLLFFTAIIAVRPFITSNLLSRTFIEQLSWSICEVVRRYGGHKLQLPPWGSSLIYSSSWILPLSWTLLGFSDNIQNTRAFQTFLLLVSQTQIECPSIPRLRLIWQPMILYGWWFLQLSRAFVDFLFVPLYLHCSSPGLATGYLASFDSLAIIIQLMMDKIPQLYLDTSLRLTIPRKLTDWETFESELASPKVGRFMSSFRFSRNNSSNIFG